MTAMNRLMKVAVVLISTVLIPFVVLVSSNASVAQQKPVASYALAKGHHKCRTGYVKRTEWHKVKKFEVRYVACVYVPPTATDTAPTTIVVVVPQPQPATVEAPTTTTVPTTTTTVATPPAVADVSVTETTTWNQTEGTSPFVIGQTESFLGTVSATITTTAGNVDVVPPAGSLSFEVLIQPLGNLTLVTETSGQTSCDISLTGENVGEINGAVEGSWHWTSDNCSGGDPLLDNTDDMESVPSLSVTTTFSDVSYSVVESD